MMRAKLPKAKIAEVLGRDRSTITREIKRNWWHDEEVPQADGHWHMTAQMQADRRRTRRRKRERLPELRDEVVRKLKRGRSPEQIAGRLGAEQHDPHRLCHETICQYVYSAQGRSDELARFLPEARKHRQPRHARRARGRIFPLESSIHNRPDEVNDRSQFGNWEGDLMIFERAQGDANVATLIERKTQHILNWVETRPLSCWKAGRRKMAYTGLDLRVRCVIEDMLIETPFSRIGKALGRRRANIHPEFRCGSKTTNGRV